MRYAGAVARLIGELARLPGIGSKTAQRLAFFLLNAPPDVAESLSSAIREARMQVRRCSVCGNLTDRDPCAVCDDEAREKTVICVVQDPRDVAAIEKYRGFKGVYHVLHGALSPLAGLGPEELNIKSLVARLESGRVKEVILATNPDVEGDATALYLARLLKPIGVTVTRIARGLPVGAHLEYADEITLGKAIEGRRVIE